MSFLSDAFDFFVIYWILFCLNLPLKYLYWEKFSCRQTWKKLSKNPKYTPTFNCSSYSCPNQWARIHFTANQSIKRSFTQWNVCSSPFFGRVRTWFAFGITVMSFHYATKVQSNHKTRQKVRTRTCLQSLCRVVAGRKIDSSISIRAVWLFMSWVMKPSPTNV